MSDYGTPPPAPSYQEGSGPMGPREHPQGTLILILGILSLVCIQILGPVAWIMGNKALAEIDANPSMFSNRSAVNAGRICGIISTVLLVLGILLGIFFVVFAIAANN
jgi:hypothetical protein